MDKNENKENDEIKKIKKNKDNEEYIPLESDGQQNSIISK